MHNVIDLINDIPEKITLKYKALIQQAREEYEGLLQKEKSIIDSTFYRVLVEAEERLKGLEAIANN